MIQKSLLDSTVVSVFSSLKYWRPFFGWMTQQPEEIKSLKKPAPHNSIHERLSVKMRGNN
jgi:hypothetical protein